MTSLRVTNTTVTCLGCETSEPLNLEDGSLAKFAGAHYAHISETSTLNKNSLVCYRNRIQTNIHPMRVDDVRVVNGGRELKVNGLWYPESIFVSDAEWREKSRFGK